MYDYHKHTSSSSLYHYQCFLRSIIKIFKIAHNTSNKIMHIKFTLSIIFIIISCLIAISSFTSALIFVDNNTTLSSHHHQFPSNSLFLDVATGTIGAISCQQPANCSSSSSSSSENFILELGNRRRYDFTNQNTKTIHYHRYLQTNTGVNVFPVLSSLTLFHNKTCTLDEAAASSPLIIYSTCEDTSQSGITCLNETTIQSLNCFDFSSSSDETTAIDTTSEETSTTIASPPSTTTSETNTSSTTDEPTATTATTDQNTVTSSYFNLQDLVVESDLTDLISISGLLEFALDDFVLNYLSSSSSSSLSGTNNSSSSNDDDSDDLVENIISSSSSCIRDDDDNNNETLDDNDNQRKTLNSASLPTWSTSSSPHSFIFEGLRLCGEKKHIEPSRITVNTLLFEIGHPSTVLSFDSLSPCLELPNEFISAIPNWVRNVTCDRNKVINYKRNRKTSIGGSDESDEMYPCSMRLTTSMIDMLINKRKKAVETKSSSPSCDSSANIFSFFPPPLEISIGDSNKKFDDQTNDANNNNDDNNDAEFFMEILWEHLLILPNINDQSSANNQSSEQQQQQQQRTVVLPLCILPTGSIVEELVLGRQQTSNNNNDVVNSSTTNNIINSNDDDGDDDATNLIASSFAPPPYVKLGYLTWQKNYEQQIRNANLKNKGVTPFASLSQTLMLTIVSKKNGTTTTNTNDVDSDDDKKEEFLRRGIDCCCFPSQELLCDQLQGTDSSSSSVSAASTPQPSQTGNTDVDNNNNSSSSNSNSSSNTTDDNETSSATTTAPTTTTGGGENTVTSSDETTQQQSSSNTFFRYVFASDRNRCFDTRCITLLFLREDQFDNVKEGTKNNRDGQNPSCSFVTFVGLLIAFAVLIGVGEIALTVFERYVQRRVLEISIKR